MKKEELDISIELIKKSIKEERDSYPCLCEQLQKSLNGGVCSRCEIFYAGKEAKELFDKIISETRVGEEFKGTIATYEGIKVVIL